MVAKALGATAAVVGAVGAAKGLLSSGGGLAGLFSTPLGGQIPAPNVLSNYASYTYVIGLSALTVDDINYPDISYKAGKTLPLICKSAGTDPENRIQTEYGKWDFFIDNLEFDSVIGLATPSKTNTTVVKFDVIEPYSIGVFMLALQRAAANAGFLNWRSAPYLLSIEFRGVKENGQMSKIPFSTRHIPIRLTSAQIKANEQGCKYSVSAFATQGQAMTTQYANLKTDAAIKGKTVQEVLQTGEQSLQAIVNQHLKELKTKGTVNVADEIVIIFPKDEQVASSLQSESGKASGSATATASPKVTSSAGEITKKIGVTQSTVNKTLVQSLADVNDIGLTSMGYSYDRRGDIGTAKISESVDEATGKWVRGNLKVDPKEGTLKFSQEMDIPSVIEQVLLSSDWPGKALASTNVDNDGMRKWWRIDTQVFYIKTDENLTKTGDYPRIIVYRVIPYKAHSGAVTAPQSAPPGYTNIKRQVIKQYDYLYTGKNSEILKFDIDFSLSFANVLAADSYSTTEEDSNGSNQQPETADLTPTANGPGFQNTQFGSYGTVVNKPTLIQGVYDLFGGGGKETSQNKIGRTFLQALRSPLDMITLNMEIMGDPYWIVNSGQGNYTAKQVAGVKDLNVDGSVAWQTSEVDIIVNFRSPFDINQTTGLYDFKSANMFDLGGSSKSNPTLGFTGLYRVNTVTSTFRGGVFKQTLKGSRRPLQESKTPGTPAGTLNTSTPKT